MTYEILDGKKQILVKKESKETLRRVKKIIFDFDGVLAQTDKSYRQTIREVVDYYFLEILGVRCRMDFKIKLIEFSTQ